ncbi:hypothetical protein MRX96_037135 [Rhipicephalus microplus]
MRCCGSSYFPKSKWDPWRTTSRLIGVPLHGRDGREGHDEFLDAYRTFFSEQTPLVDSFSEVYRKAVKYLHEEAIYHCTIVARRCLVWPGDKISSGEDTHGIPITGFELATPDCRAVV